LAQQGSTPLSTSEVGDYLVELINKE